jgi:phosphoenolpyruvate synthase/pyruvate phosphate dikinase
MKKSYRVRIYYSSYCTYELKADNEENAILKARELNIKRNELITNLENWKEADEASEIGNNKG